MKQPIFKIILSILILINCKFVTAQEMTTKDSLTVIDGVLKIKKFEDRVTQLKFKRRNSAWGGLGIAPYSIISPVFLGATGIWSGGSYLYFSAKIKNQNTSISKQNTKLITQYPIFMKHLDSVRHIVHPNYGRSILKDTFQTSQMSPKAFMRLANIYHLDSRRYRIGGNLKPTLLIPIMYILGTSLNAPIVTAMGIGAGAGFGIADHAHAINSKITARKFEKKTIQLDPTLLNKNLEVELQSLPLQDNSLGIRTSDQSDKRFMAIKNKINIHLANMEHNKALVLSNALLNKIDTIIRSKKVARQKTWFGYSQHYLATCMQLADCYALQGNLDKADLIYDEVMKYYTKMYHDQAFFSYKKISYNGGVNGDGTDGTTGLGEAFIKAAQISLQLGNYAKATDRTFLYLNMANAMPIENRMIAFNNSTRKIVLNLSNLYMALGMYDVAEIINTHILRNPSHGLNPYSLLDLKMDVDLTELYFKMGKTDQATYKLKEITTNKKTKELKALVIRSEKKPINLTYSVLNLKELYETYSKIEFMESRILYQNGKRAEALSKLKVAEKAIKNSLYIEDISILKSKILEEQGMLDSSYAALKKCIYHQAQLVRFASTSLTESERIKFARSIQNTNEIFNDFCIRNAEKLPFLKSELFNLSLQINSISLEMGRLFVNKIYSQNDTSLISKYEHLLRLKDHYQKLTLLPMTPTIQLNQMEKEIIEIEKHLNALVLNTQDSYIDNSITWKLIQHSLGENEMAVEIIKTKPIPGHNNYVALALSKNNSKGPELIRLNHTSGDSRLTFYYQQCIQHKLLDTLTYKSIWKEIQEYAQQNKVKTIYLQSEGIFHTINIETLRNPITGRYVIDEFDIKNVSSLKSLLIKTESTNTYEKSVLIGGVNYEKNKLPINTSDSSIFSRVTFLDRSGITYLPGTLRETNEINKLLLKYTITTTFLKDTLATEDTLKKLINPSILHIATHGFYMKYQKPISTAKSTSDELASKSDPMFRSGLLLSGAQKTLYASKISNLENDNILTAYEASMLNITKTKLVVLSACETGIGDIQSGEGIFGLQRAFQIAGAKVTVTSLWKVDDDATNLLMQAFYTNLIENKMTPSLAMKYAKIKIRQIFPEPYYWGAFRTLEFGL